MNITADTVSQDELWGLIMRMADPSDVLRTILNSAGDRGELRHYREVSAVRTQTMIMNDCTVIIHQHVLPDPTASGPIEATA